VNEAEELVASGHAALREGRWTEAREAFSAALAAGDSAEAHFGLGTTVAWLGDMRGAIAHLERAYAAFRKKPDPFFAAACALRIALHQRGHVGNAVAASGWTARGARLVEEHALEALQGELLLTRSFVAQEPAVSERFAREALALGRARKDLDLELCALGQLGAALVEGGRLEEGIPLLDEAMAGCLGGEPAQLETVAFTACLSMVSCARCAELERAIEWQRATEAFASRYGSPFLFAECRTVEARVFLAKGDFERAEKAALAAIALSEGTLPAYHADAVASLAELRLVQDRLDEAERLLAKVEGHGPIAAVRARLLSMSGRTDAAASLLRARLELVGQEGIESAILLELLGETEIAAGDETAALERGLRLRELGARFRCRIMTARGDRLAGRALVRHEAEGAKLHLQRAVSDFMTLAMPYEAAKTRSMLAAAMAAGDPTLAELEARAALAVFEELGAERDANAAAALLRELGVKAARMGPRAIGTLTKREREVWALLGEGLSNPEIAKRLFVSRKTVEHHVARVLSKLGLRSRAEAAAQAVRSSARSKSALE
jgi:DNA-binding NarL/FixJ family response regulator